MVIQPSRFAWFGVGGTSLEVVLFAEDFAPVAASLVVQLLVFLELLGNQCFDVVLELVFGQFLYIILLFSATCYHKDRHAYLSGVQECLDSLIQENRVFHGRLNDHSVALDRVLRSGPTPHHVAKLLLSAKFVEAFVVHDLCKQIECCGLFSSFFSQLVEH